MLVSGDVLSRRNQIAFTYKVALYKVVECKEVEDTSSSKMVNYMLQKICPSDGDDFTYYSLHVNSFIDKNDGVVSLVKS